MKGKLFSAKQTGCDMYETMIEGKVIYIFNEREQRVKFNATYRPINFIVKSGSEVFILENRETGKIKRAKMIFVAD